MSNNMDFATDDAVWFTPPLSPGGAPAFPIPGRVVEFHRQGNVLTIESCATENFPGTYTVENNGCVRKRAGSDSDDKMHYENMVTMIDLSEPALLWNVKRRYDESLIYTYIGSILVSVNPYKMYDIYGQPVVKKYEGQVLGTLPPHLFAIGSSAYNKMVKDSLSQVVVISGESGSGKTESTKLIMGYLALVNKSPSNLITEQILEASPLLESFGNAKTIKNDNSSRFGKYIQVYFESGTITGARITEYLLEKSRIVTQANEERNYHVFYEILKGLNREQKELYGLTSAEKYFYLNQGGNCTMSSKNDSEDFNALMSAFQILGFGSEEIDVILRILAGVLHMGNVYFHRRNMKHGQEGVEIGSDAEIQWIAHLLAISPEGIKKSLTTKITEARKERMTTPLTINQSLDSRDAIAKVLYSSLFTWLVSRINRIVFKGESTSINILDIFGFEDFQENSFEQLCINYANESLQHYLNKHIFKLEQIEYAKEKIEWVTINYTDNTSVISLLCKKPVGILHLLDDESNFPKGTDTSFLEKAHYNHALNEHYTRPRLNCTEFGVKHYAGSVMYNVEGFLDKNRDTLRHDVVKLLAGSTNVMISKMFQLASSARSPRTGRFVTVKPRAPTVAARFNDSLQSLLVNMAKCNPWFIRCIKPNSSKEAEKFDIGVVLEQLRYSGLLETIKIRKHGYPIRPSYAQFSARFKCLVKSQTRGVHPRELSRLILNDIPPGEYQPGSTKIFLRESLEQKLEQELYNLYRNSTIVLQRNVRMYLAKKRYHLMKTSVVKIQSYWKMKKEKDFYNGLKKSTILIQRGWRKRLRIKKRRAQEMEKRKERKMQGCVVSGLNHLEIPAELAFVFTKLEDWHPQHTERNLVKLIGGVAKNNKLLSLPPELDSCNLTKYAKENIKSQVLGMKREPISIPFLNNSPNDESIALFKLVLRFMNDGNFHQLRQQAIVNYIVLKSLQSQHLQDEVIVQLMNQTVSNNNEENRERGFFLLTNILSSLKPSKNLYKYLLKYVSDTESSYAHILQHKLLTMSDLKTRIYPPTLLEWRCNKIKSNSAVTIYYQDDEYKNIDVGSWTTIGELAEYAAEIRVGDGTVGWGLEFNEDEVETEKCFFDVISSVEIMPGFTGMEKNCYLFGREEKKTRSLEDLADSYGLSSSKLNNRYRSVEKIDVWDEDEDEDDIAAFDEMITLQKHPSPVTDHQMINDHQNQSYDHQNQPYDHQNQSYDPTYSENNYPDSDMLSIKTSRSGHPRFIKASAKRSSVTGSYSSRAYIERNSELKSSALSDTSEAPSLASHVRRVRVPSQASDVEQFLDDLFSPVLDGNLDDLSDARSLITSIKGGPVDSGGNAATSAPFSQFGFSPSSLNVHAQDFNMQRAFLQSAMAQNIQIQQQLIAQNNALQQLLQQQVHSDLPRQSPVSAILPHHTKEVVVKASHQQLQFSIPPPPPLPPELIEGSRPFVDPYGRAKTVRIGKWRWPPAGGDNFTEFKMRQESKNNIDADVVPSKAALPVMKISRPFGGEPVGKLKISSEMRMKLEQVTASVRGSNPPKRDTILDSIVIKKIGEDRKTLLAEKLGGVAPPPPPPPTVAPPLNFNRGRVSEDRNFDVVRKDAFIMQSSTHVQENYQKDILETVFLPPPPNMLLRPHQKTKLFTPNQAPYFSYNRVPWAFRLRKELFTPGESTTPTGLNLIFIQIVKDTLNGCIRINSNERLRMRSLLDINNIDLSNCANGVKFNLKKSVMEVAKSWNFYFCKFWRVETTTEVKYIGLNPSGLKLVKKSNNSLALIENYTFDNISSVYADSQSGRRVQIGLINGGRLNFYTTAAEDIETWIGIFIRSATPTPVPISSQQEEESVVMVQHNHNNSSPQHSPKQISPQNKGNIQTDGKHSLLQFAMEHFRREKFTLSTPKISPKQWTWADQVALVKYSNTPIEESLLPLDDSNNRLALECYMSIMRYMGDLQSNSNNGGEVEAVYTLLRNCHNTPPLRDELYCQIMKQTTNNNNTAQRGWRLFTILSAYFTCSDELRPFLFKYLESNSYDKRRPYHGTALVTLQNLRKTFKYGGRRNVPSVEEITAITAGRNAKRQIFRLPGGTQRVLNVKGSTVVKDIIEEMCGLLNITRSEEREEFSIYCIVEGDTFTMPLMKEEYILDVTTELYKNQQVFYLIFCRSVWYFPLRLDSESYIEVVFNQVAPDYLEGLLLIMPGGNLKQNDIHDISRIAALLHRAADLKTQPNLKETKYLLPKPALAARDMKPAQWVSLVNNYWDDIKELSPANAKGSVLEILQGWALFGSSFFSVRRIVDPAPPEEYIMALNKSGVHFLDVVTHEPLNYSPYNEIISTRKVKNEEGVLYLDIKFGNLMQQRISRIQTEHAHEISRLIRMYISIQKGGNSESREID